MAQQTTIIAIAGGKGGVGKTFLTANLAVALALRGDSTIAVDLDLGNSNLHSFLGLENRYPGVGDFLRGTVQGTLGELAVQTSVPALRFIAGDGRMPFMANITYNQKRTLVKALKHLPACYVLLDLSAGTNFNTLDLFLSADSGILVTTPEYPALMNMFVFLKNLLLRALEQSLHGEPSLREKVNELYKQSMKDPVFTVERFRRELAETHPQAAETVTSICRKVRPRLVYNMVESVQDTEIFARVDRTLAETLSIECDHFGVIRYDASVRQSLKQPGNFLLQNPSSQTSEMIDRIALRIIKYWDVPVQGSAQRLAKREGAMLVDAKNQG
jgi:flagellar biosynthesis protein FlhG